MLGSLSIWSSGGEFKGGISCSLVRGAVDHEVYEFKVDVPFFIVLCHTGLNKIVQC